MNKEKIEEIEEIEIVNDNMICFDDKYQDIFIGGCNRKDMAFVIKINEIIYKLNKLKSILGDKENE